MRKWFITVQATRSDGQHSVAVARDIEIDARTAAEAARMVVEAVKMLSGNL